METQKTCETDLKTLAKQIAAYPSQWVLILGERISYQKPEERKKILSEFANKARRSYGDNSIIMPQIYQAIQDEDYTSLRGALFGDIWNATGFTDELKEKQIEWREEYAKCMVRKENINIDNADIDLKKILKAFNGLILTTCQDETVESFLEYDKSLPVTDVVCTPYILTTSQDWYKRVQTPSGEFRHLFPREDDSGNMHALIKLYGTCKTAHRMLLSRQDFQEYYPADAIGETSASEPKTVSFLREIFRRKKLLLLGMDCARDGQLFTEGITNLLAETWSEHTERFILAENELLNSDYLEKCHLIPVKCASLASGINDLGEELLDRVNERREKPEYSKVAAGTVLDRETATELFWKYYIRRSYKNFYSPDEPSNDENYAEREAYLLEKRILGCREDGSLAKKWTGKSIRQLAIAANNLADFYDLDKCLHMAEEQLASGGSSERDRDTTAFYEKVTQKLLVERPSSRSLLLHRILSFYGSGFPLGFLLLLSDHEEDLKKWKRAGIQLTNSGIYIKRQHRKNLHERMSYADSIIIEVGENPYRQNFEKRIKEIGCVPGDSYFYPFDNKIEKKESQSKIEELFEKMLQKLHNILREKSNGYKQIRSLLQTEMPSITSKIGELNDANFRWKPALLYYLVCESRVVPTDREVYTQLVETLDRFLASPYLCLKEDGDLNSNQEIFSGRVMISLAKIALESQSFKKQEQTAARDSCAKLEKSFDEQEGKLWHSGEMPDLIFKQKMRVYFMESRICGRLSTIAEIERCKAKRGECPEQKEALDAMRAYLTKIKEQVETWESKRGTSYKGLKAEWKHLMGEYFFKQSQFCRENMEYGGKDSRNKERKMYEDSEKYYQEALDYYSKYPDQYWIQTADVKRGLADLYCQKEKSVKEGDLRGKSYKLLMDAYILYRSNLDLHGVADVLQSMGNLEDFDNKKIKANSRSPLCFYQASQNLYDYLGDEWSWNVVSRFEEGILVDSEKKMYYIQ